MALKSFDEILAGTLQAISMLPTPQPVRGLAGFTPVRVPGAELLNLYDNAHYGMGTAFYRYGVKGIADLARANAKGKQGDQRRLLLAIAQTYDAISDYFKRYALCVEDEQVAVRLRWLSENPPEDFRQGVQLFFLMWGMRNLYKCSTIGRLDLHLRELFLADVAAGRLTHEEAFGIVCDLWERLNEWGSGDTLMNVMVGGQDAQHHDDSTALSRIMLEASLAVAKTEPHINVRYHKGIDPDVWAAALRLQREGSGQATVYNDEIILPEMKRVGIPDDIACRYANDGCTEIVWDGCGRIDFNHIDAVATLELALYNGHRVFVPKERIRYFSKVNEPVFYKPHVTSDFESGEMETCQTYEELYQMFLRQFRYQLLLKLKELHHLDTSQRAGEKQGLLLNGTFEQVLQSGEDMLGKGLPMNSYMVFLGSVTTVADCLVALKKVVFDLKKYTLAQIKEAMEANFEGYEVLRAELLNAPKFGNDLDEVDLIAARIVSDMCDSIDAYRAETGFQVFPSLIGWNFVSEAYATGAMPDGRREKDPIAEHYCATPGRAKKGVTAHVNSIAKAPLARAIGVAPVHLSLPRSIVSRDDEGLELLENLNRACLSKGLMQYNIAVYDNDQLRQAQLHPEQYADLIVRVWGFSAKFVELSREMQDHIISRTE